MITLGSRGLAIACWIAALLAARAASAGVTIVYGGSGGGKTTWFAEGARVRIEVRGADGQPAGAMVIDLAARKLVIVDDAASAYTKRVLPRHETRRQEPGEPNETPIAYSFGHERRSVRAFSCYVYAGFEDRRVVEEVCVVPWGSPDVGPKEDYDLLERASAAIRAEGLGDRGLLRIAPPQAATLPGLIVSRQMIKEDHSRGDRWEIERLERGPLAAALFSVPATFHEDERLYGTFGIVRPAAPAPRMLAPSTGAAPREEKQGLTGTALLLLVLLGSSGLLLHASLLHLAAKMVFDEPRYADALVATAIAWAVGVPLELLGVPRIIGAPVGLAAIYGGIRLSYRTTRGRTVALLVMSTIVFLLVAAMLTVLGAPLARA
jgi:hypothetical protein